MDTTGGVSIYFTAATDDDEVASGQACRFLSFSVSTKLWKEWGGGEGGAVCGAYEFHINIWYEIVNIRGWWHQAGV